MAVSLQKRLAGNKERIEIHMSVLKLDIIFIAAKTAFAHKASAASFRFNLIFYN
jgi:hypothetical protein